MRMIAPDFITVLESKRTVRAFAQAKARGSLDCFVRPGFTLLELTTSLVVTAIILGALTSAMLLASQIIPNKDGPAEATIAANEIAQQFAGELYYAQTVTERSAKEVRFRVADRDGDLTPETIRYAWSGEPGDPLTRQYNDGGPAAVLDNVQNMDLSYEIQEIIEETPSLPNESAEMELSGYEDLDKLVNSRVTNSNWIGQCFQPVLPPDVLSWRITRVRFPAHKTGGKGGVSLVQLRPADGNGKPSSTVLAETPMYESDLAKSYTWQELSYGNAPWMGPSEELCVVIRQIGKGGSSAEINYDSLGGPGLVRSTDGGATWTRQTGMSMLYHAYGTMTTAAAPVIDKRYLLTGAQITLEVGSSPPARALTSTKILNRPEVPAP